MTERPVFAVRPVAGWGGTFAVPGDKSITHRAYLLALLAAGTSRIRDPNAGADCEATLRAAERLGAAVARSPGEVRITGRTGALAAPDGPLDCGNSGTALRLLAGVLAGRCAHAVLDGDASLRGRPVGRIVTPLRAMGATLRAAGGDRHPPLEIRGGALTAIDYEVPVASAQVQSCVLLAGLAADGLTSVALPGPARDHTQRMLPLFGVEPVIERRADGASRVGVRGPAALTAADVRVPGDFSSAAFFLAAAAATPGARVCAAGVSLNPTRTGLLDVLEAMGARVERRPHAEAAGEPAGDVTVEGPERLDAFDVPPGWLPRMIDEVPAWTLAATAARGRSRVSGAAELRVKESDRIATLAAGLAAIGARVAEHPDGLEITGGPVTGGTAESAGDHRIAMTLALFGLRAPVRVLDPANIATSYPEFAAHLALLAPGALAAEER